MSEESWLALTCSVEPVGTQNRVVADQAALRSSLMRLVRGGFWSRFWWVRPARGPQARIMPLTSGFVAGVRKTFQDFAKSVPNPFRPKPLTSAFAIRACPTRAGPARIVARVPRNAIGRHS